MKRLLQDIRKYRWVLLSCLGVFLVGRWAYSYGRPHAVMDLPSPVLDVHKGIVYVSVRDPESYRVDIKSSDGSGGSLRTLATEDTTEFEIRSFTATDDGLFYILAPRRMRPDPSRLPAAPNAGPVRNLLSMTNPRAARASVPRLRKIPLAGGAISDAPVQLRAGAVIAGDSLYWVESRPDKVSAEPGKSEEAPRPQSDIVMVPLKGGAERRLANVAFERTRLQVNGKGVFWIVRHQDANQTEDLYGVTGSDMQPIRVTDYQGAGLPSIVAGKLYWLGDVDGDPKTNTPAEVTDRGFKPGRNREEDHL